MQRPRAEPFVKTTQSPFAKTPFFQYTLTLFGQHEIQKSSRGNLLFALGQDGHRVAYRRWGRDIHQPTNFAAHGLQVGALNKRHIHLTSGDIVERLTHILSANDFALDVCP